MAMLTKGCVLQPIFPILSKSILEQLVQEQREEVYGILKIIQSDNIASMS